MKIYMLIDCTKYSFPKDIDISLKNLAERNKIPYQTARNAVASGKRIRYIEGKIIVINVPNEDLLS